MEDLNQQIVAMRQSLFDEEILNDYYVQLEQLTDDDNSKFVEDVITMFFGDSNNLLAIIEEEMNKTPIDHTQVDRFLHQLKGSSASIGANKVTIEASKTREYFKEGDIEGGKVAFQKLIEENNTLRAKLESYFQLLAQVER